MLFRFILFMVVMLFLGMAYGDYFWRSRILKRIFKVLAFDGPRASATEQISHYFCGMTIFAFFNMIASVVFHRPFDEADWFSYLIAALAGGLIKESADFIFDYFSKRKWHPRDSVVDLSFWILGGLTAPLLKFWL